jgi:GAF domain-containing protein
MVAHRGDPHRSVLDVGSAIASGSERDEILVTMARTIGEAMAVSAVEIYSFDYQQDSLMPEARWVSAEALHPAGAFDHVPVQALRRPDLHDALFAHELVQVATDDHELSKRERQLLADTGCKSLLITPLRLGHEVLGVLRLMETRASRRFSAAERNLLDKLCGLAAMAIRNAQLVRERGDRMDHMTLLLDVGRAVTSSLVLEDVLKAVCHYVGETMHVSSCDIELYDKHSDLLTYAACWDSDPAITAQMIGVILDPDQRPSDRLAIEGKPVECHIDDVDLPAAERAALERYGEKTTLDLPLVYGREVIGILSLVERERVRRFTHEERALFQQLGVLASIAIHNAQVFRRMEDQTRHLQALLAISRLWATCKGSGELFAELCREAARAFDARCALLYELDAATATVALRGSWLADPGDGCKPAAEVEDLAEHPEYERVLSCEAPGVERLCDHSTNGTRADTACRGDRAVLNVPLVFRGRPIGVLTIVDVAEERVRDSAEIELAVGIGEQAALALRAGELVESGT